MVLVMIEESMRRVPNDSCFAFVAAGEAEYDKSRPVLYDDEPQNAKEVERHPERIEIREAARKEVQQWVDMKIGESLGPEERARVENDPSILILNAKMVYKRKYTFDPVSKKEYFLKVNNVFDLRSFLQWHLHLLYHKSIDSALFSND